MTEKIELAIERAKAGAAQLLNAITILAGVVADMKKEQVEMERHIAEIQHGQGEPRFAPRSKGMLLKTEPYSGVETSPPR